MPGAPYFVFVDGGGAVAGEGAAQQWSQVVSLYRDARGDAELSHRSQQAVDELTAAGITPGHPSLYGTELSPVRDAIVLLGAVLAITAGLRSAWSP